MKEFLQQAGYVLEPLSNIWSRSGYGGIAYSDGDEAEQRIATIISHASDVTVLSTELRQHCTDWASLYHLSGTRANILRPFKNILQGDVLEIGAGCGAITRYLGECGANVLALEGSPRRAAIARSRTRDLDNVTVLAEKFDQFQCDHQFDVITLIGVLEYANLFTTGENPALSMLERVRSLLKPEGKLIIAIENQLGLKYFAGAPEDHLGQPMYGIEERYRTDQPQTFGRAVLAGMLKQSGFASSNFLSPLPDYKLPVSILTEDGVNSKDFDAGAFAWQSVQRDPQLPPLSNFSLELVWPTVFANQLALDLANSFLIVASPQIQALVEEDVLAYHYSTDRKPEFCKETVFKREVPGKVCIKYNRLFSIDNGQSNNPLIKFVCPAFDKYYFGKPLSLEFIQIVTRDGWTIDEVAQFIKRYLDVLGNIAREQGIQVDFHSPYSKLPGDFFDSVPQNLIVQKDGSVSLIDKEWELSSPIELGHILFRMLLLSIGSITRFGSMCFNLTMTRGQFVDAVLEASDLALNMADYERYIGIEERITEQVTGRSAKEAVRWWPEHPLRTLNLNQAVSERDNQIASLHQVVADRDVQIASLTQAVSDARRELEQVLASKSWQITKPLRFARRVAVSGQYAAARRVLSDNGRALWRALPISYESKRKLKGLLFKTFPWVFRWSKAYQAWDAYSTPVNYSPVINAQVAQWGEAVCEYVPLLESSPLKQKPVKLICFYLPQFHAIPENNEWWGDGFTEWTNVQPAQPQFAGHYQPHVPGELGYYNLLDPAVQRRQVDLAKLYGIEGFCFYLYWFGGKRLLETPTENYLNDKSLDLPFCLCWANENWSRRWDGLDNDILISQHHSAEDDLAFIEYISKYLKDSRYIRVDGKPLLLVYRPSLLPSTKETVKRWRKWCRDNGVGEIYLAYTQSFDTIDPIEYGFDAAIEFPPNNMAPPLITKDVPDRSPTFAGQIYHWGIFPQRSKNYQEPAYTLFRGVNPSWDNTARKKTNGTILYGSSPLGYQQWLFNAIEDTVKRFPKHDQRLVFINAWNEWAEGAHLEPDQRYGYAYLQATRDALLGRSQGDPAGPRKIVLVTHDAHPHGAQLLALNLARTLSADMGFHVDMVCLGDGSLKVEYAQWAHVHDLTGLDARGREASELAKKLYDTGHRQALVNTTVSGHFLETLTLQGIECGVLIHELRGVLDQLKLHDQALAIAVHAKTIIFPAAEVAAAFADVAPMDPAKVVIRPQGLYKRRHPTADRARDRQQLRQKLNLPADSQIILGVGYADHRKGIDLFVDAGLGLAERHPKARWVWIGHWEQGMQRLIEKKLAAVPALKDRFIFPGLQSDTEVFYGGADVFALTSREDPFPSVVLEAMDAGLPVVGFENAGGFISLLNEGCGQLVEKDNATAFGTAVASLLAQPDQRLIVGARGAQVVAERFSFRHYVFDLLDHLGAGLDRISVVVPNYNYEHYLPERLGSILQQDYPIFEIIFLDDQSQDESADVARGILAAQTIDYRIIQNENNSGSVFKQWKKGVDLAKGTYIWIAEADDSCSKNFLSETRKGFCTPEVVLSYCESRQIDENGHLLANNYLDYVADIGARHWLTPFVMDGDKEVAQSFSIKNVIPNVSAVMFEAQRLRTVLDEHIQSIQSYRVAGDWLVYVLLLKNGRIAFSPLPANAHRRHQNGVTLGSFNEAQLQEIREMQAFVASEFEVSAEKSAVACAYTERLAEQFDLPQHECDVGDMFAVSKVFPRGRIIND
jgi:2-polyprenyl-3-methyl-5-hydroxy-6-metoxy-1,4-benzoquinol methylase